MHAHGHAHADIYDIPFPSVYLDFIRQWFWVFQLDVITLVKVECVKKVRGRSASSH
jgi:hypothetical protein